VFVSLLACWTGGNFQNMQIVGCTPGANPTTFEFTATMLEHFFKVEETIFVFKTR
jgi:hypothetical protein